MNYLLFQGHAKPLHEQLKDIIKQKIVIGELKPGDVLPGERQLIDMYKVSRVTVRQAIGVLVNDGILYRQQGKGTFVAHKRIERPLAKLLGVAEELKMDNLTIDISVISKGFMPSMQAIPKELQIFDDKPLFYVTRLIKSDAQPLLIDRRFFPQSVGLIVQNLDLSKDTILNQLELYGFKISHGVQSISADKASAEDAKLLHYKSGKPLLVAKRTIYVEGNIPIDYSCTHYRADRYEYRIDLQRSSL
jgi:GntR family transcriptional regulator